MRKYTICLFALCLMAFLCNPTWGNSQDEVYEEIWDSSYFMSTIEIHITQNEDELIGVCYVYNPFYGTDTYHFTGNVDEEGVIHASHHSGHTFVGHFLAEDEAEGKITLAKKGHVLSLHAVRRQ